MKRIICLLPVLLVLACAATHQNAIECDPATRNFLVELPQGWKQINSSEVFLITREDPYSQYILFRQRHVDEHFPHTAKSLYKDMPPLEAANVIIDEMKNDPSVLNLKITETAAAPVGSYPGFKVAFEYGIKEGYSFSAVYYGFLQGTWLYSVRYNASPDAACTQDIEDFLNVVKSFRCKG